MGIGSCEEEEKKETARLSEIIKEKLYFAPLSRPEDSATLQGLPKPAKTFSIDDELVRILANALPPKLPNKIQFLELHVYSLSVWKTIITYEASAAHFSTNLWSQLNESTTCKQIHLG